MSEHIDRLRAILAACGETAPTSHAYSRISVSPSERNALRWAIAEIERLQGAIRKHRDMRGDDRCYLDDAELYGVLPEGDTRPAIDSQVTLGNCIEFIKCRQQGRKYVSPQREIERLTQENADLRDAVRMTYAEGQNSRIDDGPGSWTYSEISDGIVDGQVAKVQRLKERKDGGV